MSAHHNPRLEERLDHLRLALLDLASATDENLRGVLLLLTTDEAVTDGIRLRDTSALESAVLERSMALLALQGPVARDLRWAMAVIRIAKDYERVGELTGALARRVRRLSDTLLENLLHGMTDVMRHVLQLHALVLGLWRQPAENEAIPEEALRLAMARVEEGIRAVENRAVEAIMSGQGSAEQVRELVLATRHLTRIAVQLGSMPRELQSARRA